MFGKVKSDVQNISIDMIKPNPYQPRKTFTDDSLIELSNSIKSYGILQPIIVRKVGKTGYELIAGERRWRAAQLAGLKEIPAIVRESRDSECAVMALIENLQREDLNFLEEAEGYYQLITEHNLTQEELAQKVGKNQSTIANKLRLLKLSPEIKKIISREKLSERHARSLLKLPDDEMRKRVLERVCERGLTVRETEELIERIISKELMDDAHKTGKKSRNFIRAFNDIRIFVNQVKKLVADIKDAGLNARYQEQDKGDFIEVVVQIPKNPNA
jgi:ParB family chromosome partitioning protein